MMSRILSVKRLRVASLLLVVCLLVIAVSNMSSRSLKKFLSRKLHRKFLAFGSNSTLEYDYDYSDDDDYYNYLHFYGPSRVPKIADELFPKPKYDRKYFIYDCSQMLCGGLGDRQEGIVAAYLIAQMMGRKFGVIMTIPCDLSLILEENQESWIIPKEEIFGLQVLPYKVLDHPAWTLRDEIGKMPLEQRFPADVVLFNTNQEFVNYLMKLPRFADLKWAQNRTATEIYNIVLRRLFRLKPKHQKIFDEFQIRVRKGGRKLVCGHIRLHDDWLVMNRLHPKSADYVKKILAFLNLFNDTSSYKIFVATNAELVRQQANNLFPGALVEIPGPIIHVDEIFPGDNDAEAGFIKVILDQMILSTCDVLFMSDSGFGRIATMMRGTDKNLYNIQGKYSYKDTNFFPPYW